MTGDTSVLPFLESLDASSQMDATEKLTLTSFGVDLATVAPNLQTLDLAKNAIEDIPRLVISFEVDLNLLNIYKKRTVVCASYPSSTSLDDLLCSDLSHTLVHLDLSFCPYLTETRDSRPSSPLPFLERVSFASSGIAYFGRGSLHFDGSWDEYKYNPLAIDLSSLAEDVEFAPDAFALNEYQDRAFIGSINFNDSKQTR